jgi:mono/diheme cytochrome c family protein
MDSTRDNPFNRIQRCGWVIFTFLIFAFLLGTIAWFLRHPAPSLDDAAAIARYQTKERIDQAQATSLAEPAIEAAIPRVARQLAATQPAAVKKSEQLATGYVRSAPPGAAESGPPPQEAMLAYMTRGARIYAGKCQVCHGSEAMGDGANSPSLTGCIWAVGQSQRFSMIILNGLKGPSSNGKSFGAGMPSQAASISAEDLAAVMTYVRNHFGNRTDDVISVEKARAALTIAAARPNAGKQVSAVELSTVHLRSLLGPTIDPKSMVDPITLARVKAPVTAPVAAPATTPDS